MVKYKIAIDVSPLNDGNSVRGVGYYTKSLVKALQDVTKVNSEYKDFQIDLVTQKSDLQSHHYDLVHYPYFDPFSLTLPSQHNCPFIVTIHDLIPRQFKKYFPVGLKGEINWQLERYRARKAAYLITISHYSKYAISDLLNYPVDKVYVTYLAADPSFKPLKNQKLLDKIKAKYHLPDKFILYLGDINWNKNIPTLVKVCTHLNYPLVIVGSAATKKTPKHPWTMDILWLQDFCKSNSNVICTGFVPDTDLPVVFNLATLYCQPSYAEGFGLPVVQAMQSGLPVIYSQETSLPEIMDFNGEFFDPYDPKSLETALTKLWNDPKLRTQYSQQGIIHSKTFDWKSTAIQTLAVYKLALVYGK